MKVSALIAQLQAMPQDADVDIDLGEEFHSFTVVHHTAGEPPQHHVVLELEPDPPHLAEIAAKHQILADAAPELFEAVQAVVAVHGRRVKFANGKPPAYGEWEMITTLAQKAFTKAQRTVS